MEVNLQLPNPSLLTDPCLTASLYCNRRLELMAREVLGSLAVDLATVDTSPASFFWYSRYGKCGEHLKVRVHGGGSTAATAQDSLTAHASRFFASRASDPGEDDPWISKSGIPPIDLEDEQQGDYPNKTLLWTHYRRSPVVFGAEVYLDDDVHVAHFCRCQAAVTTIALEVLLPRLGDQAFAKHRQSAYIRILLTAISVLGLSAAETAAYLAYHRDWLIRSLVHNVAPPGSTTAESLLREIRGRAESTAATLRPLTGHVTNALQDSNPSIDYCRTFHASLSAFYRHVSKYRGNAHFDRDPFTRDFAFLPIFKVLHQAANQFGFRLSNEAYVFDLLFQATEPLCPNTSKAED